MKRIGLYFFVGMLLAGCSSVLITGRKQVMLVPDSEVLTMSFQSYQEFIDSVPLSRNTEQVAMVKRSGMKIAQAVENYMIQQGREVDVTNFDWEFNLVQDSTVNAFCMPGGKVVFFEGILPMTRTEGGMAVVMGHEIAHAVAKHSHERISQQMLLSHGATVTDLVLSQKSDVARASMQTLYGLGAQMGVVLPYSRKHEYEADRLGLIFMAMAGYDPTEAIGFWERMSANSSDAVFEFMSTHPSNAKRIENMKKVLPEAMGYLPANN